MDARDSYTAGHSQRICDLAQAVGKALGCSEDDILDLQWAALLHDIGKIGVPDEILRKPGPLSFDEWRVMRQHPLIGADIINPVSKLENVVPIVRHHQEKFDGSGYPDGLSGSEIPLGARILAVVDAYIAITDERVYRNARSRQEALLEIQRNIGTHFDPAVVEAFIQSIPNQQN
jgi:putative nucleotidyltransferase with HDIG domain